ncbi:NAD-dependent epimerase/dehydratase family protein [Tsuneonella mangrovi]|uniref:NAD-dependent epimerase/dehydratase family protein n=1 Tax=Tsuneonella mangrovi TaxID=1982042 RepID=UPI0023E81528|nr:NAD(P)H-binding protein [Tsuneonella mangrovi]
MSDRPLVALTGGTGFVGQMVCEALTNEGIAVRALARTIPQAPSDIEWVGGSLSDETALARLVEGADSVLHVAGLTNAPDPAAFEAANITGTQMLLEAAAATGVPRFVFVSSLSAREPGLSAYGASKERAERLVEASDLDWTIVRPPGVYGPRDKDYLDLFKAAKLGVVPMPPGGSSSIIHARDLADLLVAMLPGGDMVSGRMFEPDDGQPGGWSHADMARMIGEAVDSRPLVLHLPKPLLHFAARIDGLVRGDAAKLTPDRVGYMSHPDWVARTDWQVPPEVWAPRIATPEGLKETANWYRAQGWL